MYEYNVYDIIDFLEEEYINDWLSTIPDEIWKKNIKIIMRNIYMIENANVISFLINKINFDLPTYIVKYFKKISLGLLKYCFENYRVKLLFEIKKKHNVYIKIVDECVEFHNYDFNKYFYEKIYSELDPKNYNCVKNIKNKYELLCTDDGFYKNNMFYCSIIERINNFYYSFSNYDTIKYYHTKFENIFKIIKSSSKNFVFKNIFMKGMITSYDEMIKLKNILGITDSDFKQKILLNDYQYTSIISYACKYFDIDFVINILNLCDDNILLKEKHVAKIIASVALSNKIENVFLIYNYFAYHKNFVFTNDTYTKIITDIIYSDEKKHYEYYKIIVEFINLGGRIKGYSIYTDYIEKLKIKN